MLYKYGAICCPRFAAHCYSATEKLTRRLATRWVVRRCARERGVTDMMTGVVSGGTRHANRRSGACPVRHVAYGCSQYQGSCHSAFTNRRNQTVQGETLGMFSTCVYPEIITQMESLHWDVTALTYSQLPSSLCMLAVLFSRHFFQNCKVEATLVVYICGSKHFGRVCLVRPGTSFLLMWS